MEVYPCHVFEARVLTCRVPQLRNKIVHLVNICLQNKLGWFISLCTFSVYPSQALCDVWVTSIDSHIQIICSPRCSMRHDVVPDECLHATVRRFARSSSSEELFTPTINRLLTLKGCPDTKSNGFGNTIMQFTSDAKQWVALLLPSAGNACVCNY